MSDRSSSYYAAEQKSSNRRELISFQVRDQSFCIDVMSVREIRGWTQATPLAHAPDFVRGVINLRGSVLPIIDLAARLGLGLTEPTARHAILVARVNDQLLGLLVDGVDEILSVEDQEIQATPDVGSGSMKEFVTGILPKDGQMITVISTDNIIPMQDAWAA